ncbi:MAG: metallophosphoesterase [Bacteroidales bacterium]|nr:metallophosphoesterase [Bacteroidales bacterium]
MKKIIHLSDLHIGYRDCGKKFRTLVENMTFLKQPAENYIVVITGDLEENANEPSHAGEALEALGRLQAEGYTVLPVPGNHDYGTGSLGNPDMVPVFKERFYGNREVIYPKLDIIGDVAFIGLDSTAEELSWHDRHLSEGELGADQLERLRIMLDGPVMAERKKVVYMHHHPFDFKLGRQLRDSDELRSVISNRVDMLLFGHYHRSRTTAGKIYHGVWGIPRCYNAGSSTHKNGNIGYHRVIDLSNPDPRMDYDGAFI